MPTFCIMLCSLCTDAHCGVHFTLKTLLFPFLSAIQNMKPKHAASHQSRDAVSFQLRGCLQPSAMHSTAFGPKLQLVA